jgi:CheY-like chemotaxis protein/HPt (histidine-containing phosphotransfer) domain-containing protein
MKMALNSCVLLVEDNAVNQEVGCAMMEAFGCRVDVASNGYEAIGRMEACVYDVVFMDCEMPLMDGFEATRIIREREKNGLGRTTIVALTAHDSDADRLRCFEAGMDDHLSKPFLMRELSGMLEKWANNNRTQGSSACAGVAPGPGPPEIVEEDYLDRKSLDKIKSLGPNGPKMLSAVIGIYLNDSPVLIERLCESLNTGDADGVAHAAHALKSASANLGAMPLAELCRQVEDIARSNSVQGCNFLISRILLEYNKAKEALRGEIQRGLYG